MAYSSFRVDYHDGMPDVANEDLVYWEPAINDVAGGYSAMESVEDPDQAEVLMQIQSSTAKLTEMKANPIYTWVEDVQGWGVPQGDVAMQAAAHDKKQPKPAVYTLTRTYKRQKIVLASGVNISIVLKYPG